MILLSKAIILCFSYGVLVTAISLSQVMKENPLDDFMSDDFIQFLNLRDSTWKAGRNFAKGLTEDYLSVLGGVLPASQRQKPKPCAQSQSHHSVSIPNEFDSRKHWPQCHSIKEIKNQGCCGSCWAVGTVSAMSDRFCIHSGGKNYFGFSIEDILTCNQNDRARGCNGGDPASAWKYWMEEGIVSGGNYNSEQGCRPYSIIPTCPGTANNNSQWTPPCVKRCGSKFGTSYGEDLQYGQDAYSVESNERAIQLEILENGPVVGILTIYADFLHYKSGVYKHIAGKKYTDHAVKIIGWGEENGVPYWLVANSWDSTWGEDGFFKIIRGINECGLEEYITAGIPNL